MGGHLAAYNQRVQGQPSVEVNLGWPPVKAIRSGGRRDRKRREGAVILLGDGRRGSDREGGGEPLDRRHQMIFDRWMCHTMNE